MNPKVFYVMNYQSKHMEVYNANWKYQETKTLLFRPTYSINNNGVIYVSTDNQIFKYDKNFNLIKTLSSDGKFYRGIYYNPSNQLIYVAAILSKNIQVFDKDLNLNTTINTKQFPWFITGFNDKLVVGDNYDGNVYFYQNSSLIQSIRTQCTARISSILFDDYNHMLVLCETNNILYIYHLNGSFAGINFTVCEKPTFINFDSNNRLIMTCKQQIFIYQ
jgi:hypothetical protein